MYLFLCEIDRETGRQTDIYHLKFWKWFPAELSESHFPGVSELHAGAPDCQPSHCNFLLPSDKIVCMSLLLEHNHVDGLAVGTTHSASLVSQDNGTHDTGRAVNTAKYAETGKQKTKPSVCDSL